MTRYKALILLFATLAASGCEKPSWPSTLTRPTTLCEFVSTSDYVVKVSPISISTPRRIELSPWPKAPFWATPVEWTVDDTVLTLPVANRNLPILTLTQETRKSINQSADSLREL